MKEPFLHRAMTSVRRRMSLRVEKPYTTHMPVLAAIPRLTRVERVLELGCGDFSTLTFLNRSIYPQLQALHSWEDDRAWMERVQSAVADDPRIEMEYIQDWDASLSARDMADYDLIFVDNGRQFQERAATIRTVMERAVPRNIVVIHDFEFTTYRIAAQGLPHRYAFSVFYPHTGVVWQGDRLQKRSLQQVRRILQENAQRVLPDQVEDWAKLFEPLCRPDPL
jgi:predicted O-methyltransferase YrrM